MADNPLLAAALDYAGRGFQVIPLNGKLPRTAHGLRDAARGPEQIRAWWSSWPTANVGIVTGETSGIVVLDVDGEAGEASLAGLVARFGPYPPTLEARTGGGGRHLYFGHPGGGRRIGNRQGIAPKLDVRGDGGYVVAPPSGHKSGSSYTWLTDLPPADPGWFLKVYETRDREAKEAKARKQAEHTAPLFPVASQPAPPDHDHTLRRAEAYLRKMEPAVQGSNGSGALFNAALAMVRGFELPEGEALDLLRRVYNPTCEPPWSEPELAHKVSDAAASEQVPLGYLLNADPPARSALVDLRALTADPEVTRPIFQLRPGELHDAVEWTIRRLATDAGTFQRSGALVRVVCQAEHSAETDRVQRPAGALTIRPHTPASLRTTVAKVANLMRFDARAKAWVSTDAKDCLLQAILAAGEYPGIPVLRGVTTAPVLRLDGTILDVPGYDAETGLVYAPGAEYPAIPERPTREQAQAALDALFDLVADFPFKTEADRSAWLAAVLTIVVRESIPGPTPLFMIDANSPGTGKTLLARLAALIATGQAPATIAWTDDGAEIEKRLSTVLFDGDRALILDEVTTTLGGQGALQSVLTARRVAFRVLGKSEKVAGDWSAVVFATGNNVQVAGDMPRRVLPVRLQTDLEQPETRTGFRHPDLEEHTRREHPRLLAAVLTIARAWHAAGKPRGAGLPGWGSFEDWTSAVRCPLVWLGLPDPIGSRADVASAISPEQAAARRVVLLIEELLADLGQRRGITAGALVKEAARRRAEGAADLEEALEELGCTRKRGADGLDPLVVGRRLNRLANRVLGGRRLTRGEVKTKAGVLWAVQRLGDDGDVGDVSPALGCELSGDSFGSIAGTTPPSSPTSPDPDPPWWRDAPDNDDDLTFIFEEAAP